jgi:hypothetical protein
MKHRLFNTTMLMILGFFVVTIVIFVLLRRLSQREHFEEIVNASLYNKAGIGSITGCKGTQLAFGATIDDLLKSGFFGGNVAKTLGAQERINRRVCPDPSIYMKRNVLQQGVDANFGNCKVTIDGHDYELRSKAIPLLVNTRKTNEKQLVVVSKNNADFINFLLTRPLFFMVEDSQPYVVTNEYFVYSTFHVPNVMGFEKFPAEETTIPIRVNPFTSNVVPDSQAESLTSAIFNIRKKSSDTIDVATLPLAMYYIHRPKSLGDAVVMQDNITKRVSGNVSIATAIKGILDKKIGNPSFTVEFKCTVPADPKRLGHLRKKIPLLSVSSQLQDISCTYKGRGIMLISTRDEILRSMPIPTHSFIRETAVASPNWVCLDFLGITKDTVNGDVICGHDKNTISLWLPCDVPVHVVYVVTPTMKVAIGTFYNEKIRKRELIFVQSNHCDDTMNDLVGAIEKLEGELYLHSYDAENVRVNDIRLRYGVINLVDWYTDRQLSS